jgi:NAD(P)-dependent dehydrogenase (short-subunit alcohol dehydrogenase family)
MSKVVLITGASAGIGKVTAAFLAKAGYIVYGAARRVERMKDIPGVNPLSMDVTVEASMQSAIKEIIHAEGHIDVLINNAGFGSYGALEDVAIQDARYQLDVNVFGAARLIQLVLPHMREQRSGKIVNVSSMGGKIATPFGGWYHASKFALEGLSDSLRNEVRNFGIDVIVIEPGGITSEWGGIALDSLVKRSTETAYKDLAGKFVKGFQETDGKTSDPIVIARLIKKAIEAPHPKTRYVAGYMAKPVLFFRKILSDRLMDRLMMSRLK